MRIMRQLTDETNAFKADLEARLPPYAQGFLTYSCYEASGSANYYPGFFLSIGGPEFLKILVSELCKLRRYQQQSRPHENVISVFTSPQENIRLPSLENLSTELFERQINQTVQKY